MSNPSDSRPWWDGDFVWRPPGDGPPPEPVPSRPVPGRDADEPAAVRPLQDIACWRCGKGVAANALACPHCAASLGPARPRLRPRRPPDGDDGVMPMIWFFVGFLGVSLLNGIILIGMARKGDVSNEIQLGLTLLVEGIDTLLVMAAIWILPRPPSPPRVEPVVQGLTWGFAGPLLLCLLGINVLYHTYLQNFLGAAVDETTFGLNKLSPLVILIICVQPAIVEELFFRHLALGLLRWQMGKHGAVLVSSVMFALAHIGAPLSMPVLGLLGMAFGYVRLYSRSLVLPMLMHFLHNFAIIMLMVP